MCSGMIDINWPDIANIKAGCGFDNFKIAVCASGVSTFSTGANIDLNG